MQFIKTPILDLFVIQLDVFEDERGFFARSFCKNEFKKIGFEKEFVQINHSFNRNKGTIRGMHFQRPPHTETKLIRCIEGSVYDVVVDLRKSSPTYLNHFGVELSAKNLKSILIPDGLAHGFQTLEDNSALIYHHSNFYSPNSEDGVRYNDSSLNISWKLPPINISNKDLSYPLINQNFESISI
jgi:dTDP-4-dehydrorhamnose 3,5-epimerase